MKKIVILWIVIVTVFFANSGSGKAKIPPLISGQLWGTWECEDFTLTFRPEGQGSLRFFSTEGQSIWKPEITEIDRDYMLEPIIFYYVIDGVATTEDGNLVKECLIVRLWFPFLPQEEVKKINIFFIGNEKIEIEDMNKTLIFIRPDLLI